VAAADDATPTQRTGRIIRRLELLGPGPAVLFRDAALLVRDTPVPLASRVHLVWHLLRETESALRAVLLPLPEGPAPRAKGCLVCGMAQENKETQKEEIRAVCASLGLPEGAAAETEWQWLAARAHGRAHRDALGLPSQDDQQLRAHFTRWESFLDAVLDRYEATYLTAMRNVEKLAAIKQPTRHHVRQLRNNLPNNRNALRVFFGRLTSPNWLAPLQKVGYFDHPTPPEVQPDGSVNLPPWPPAEYLTRMASVAPERVAKVLRVIPASDNTMVAYELLDACQKLPPALVAGLCPTIKTWLRSVYPNFLASKTAPLVTRLAADGHHAEALDLARYVLGAK